MPRTIGLGELAGCLGDGDKRAVHVEIGITFETLIGLPLPSTGTAGAGG